LDNEIYAHDASNKIMRKPQSLLDLFERKSGGFKKNLHEIFRETLDEMLYGRENLWVRAASPQG